MHVEVYVYCVCVYCVCICVCIYIYIIYIYIYIIVLISHIISCFVYLSGKRGVSRGSTAKGSLPQGSSQARRLAGGVVFKCILLLNHILLQQHLTFV